jgi:hypothetical protein
MPPLQQPLTAPEERAVSATGGEPRDILGQVEIAAFLTAHGVEPLGQWRPGEAVLYVVEDAYRSDTAHCGALPGQLRPSVADRSAGQRRRRRARGGQGRRVVRDLQDASTGAAARSIITRSTRTRTA